MCASAIAAMPRTPVSSRAAFASPSLRARCATKSLGQCAGVGFCIVGWTEKLCYAGRVIYKIGSRTTRTGVTFHANDIIHHGCCPGRTDRNRSIGTIDQSDWRVSMRRSMSGGSCRQPRFHHPSWIGTAKYPKKRFWCCCCWIAASSVRWPLVLLNRAVGPGSNSMPEIG